MGRWAARLLLVVVPAALVVLPWSIRNWRVTGEFIPLSTLGGNVFLGGNNPAVGGGKGEARGSYGWSKGLWAPPERTGLLTGDDLVRLETMSEAARDRLYRERAWEYVRAHPGASLALVGHKMVRLWDLVPAVERRRGWLPLGAYYAVLVLALAGIWLARRNWRVLSPLYLGILATVLTVAVTWGDRRFRHPLEPELVLFAGVAVAQGAAAWGRRTP